MQFENKMEISIIYPAYNEAGNLPELMEKTGRALVKLGIPAEVILVNDCSTDGTGEVAEGLKSSHPYLAVIHHPRHEGLTASLSTGFKKAAGKYIIFLCADLQSDPEEDIPLLYGKLLEDYDMVLGWRQGRKEKKVIVSKIYHFLVRLLFGLRFHDINWIKGFRRDVVAHMRLRAGWHRYIAVLADAAGSRITEVKTNYYPRKSGQSKFGRKRVFAGFFDLCAVKLYVSYGEKPIYFFGMTAMVLIIIAVTLVFCAIFIPANRMILSIMAALFALGSLGSFSIGLLGDLLVSLADEFSQSRGD